MRTKEEIRAALDAIVEAPLHDQEADHGKADDLLVEMLRACGEDDFADQFEKLEKWYA